MLTLMIQKQDKDVVYERNGETFEDNGIYHLDRHHLISLKLPTPSNPVYT